MGSSLRKVLNMYRLYVCLLKLSLIQREYFVVKRHSKYFSADFQTVLERVREAGSGVSPWKDGAYYDAAVCEDYGDTSPLDPDWYFSASEDFKATEETLQIENHPI